VGVGEGEGVGVGEGEGVGVGEGEGVGEAAGAGCAEGFGPPLGKRVRSRAAGRRGSSQATMVDTVVSYSAARWRVWR
jgi:hypothetical protein